MFKNQITIKKKIIFSGLGLHSGLPIKIVIFPSDVDTGIKFIRTDLKNSIPINAVWKNIIPANLCTKISNEKNQEVSTIEHLMFSFYSLGITNLLIETNGPEVPIMDGSAKIFIDEILNVGLILQNKKVKKLKILKSFEFQMNNQYIQYLPNNSDNLEIDYTISYNDHYIKKQNLNLKDVQKNYLNIFDSRTFCHQEDLEKIFSMGLAKGGSLDNAIVIAGNKILNQEGLRSRDEFVKHKILDCLGDLYLSGFFISGKVICRHGGHHITAGLLKKIFKCDSNYLVEDSEMYLSSKIDKNKLSNYQNTT